MEYIWYMNPSNLTISPQTNQHTRTHFTLCEMLQKKQTNKQTNKKPKQTNKKTKTKTTDNKKPKVRNIDFVEVHFMCIANASFTSKL